MFSISYSPTIVNRQKPALTTADLNALEDAGVDHVQDGATHWFSRECDHDGCTAHYVFRITEDDRLFSGIVGHMAQPYALYCKAHTPAQVGGSLIKYAPKSGGASGNGGSGRGRTHRNRQSKAAQTPKWWQRWVELEALIEKHGLVNLTAAEIKEYYKLEAKWRKYAGKAVA